MSLSIQIKNQDGCRRDLGITVPADQVNQTFDSILKEFKSRVSVPGFRQGKAPIGIIENRYKKEILDEVIRRTVPQAYQDAIKEKELKPVTEPIINHVHFHKGENLDFDVQFEVAPEFELPDYQKIELSTEAVLVEDSEIEKTIQNILSGHADEVPKEDDGAFIEDGDITIFDYEAFVDGEKIDSREMSRVIVTDHNEMIDFYHGLKGLKVGEEKQIDIILPENFHLQQYANKKAEYHVKIHEIKSRSIPELNEEFIKQLGEEFSSVEDFKTKIKEDILKTKENIENEKLKVQVIEWLGENTQFDIPSSMVRDQINQIKPNLQMEWSQKGIDLQDENNQNDFTQTITKDATNQVKLAFILYRISKEEKIEVTDEDLDHHFQIIANQYHTDIDTVRNSLKQQNKISEIKQRLLDDKTLQWVIDRAKKTEKTSK